MKHIKVMADYQCWPLWHEKGAEVGNIDPSSLPITQKLQEELLAWAGKLDATLDRAEGRNSGFKTKSEWNQFNQKGFALANKLQSELGSSYSIRFHEWPLSN